jgi:hypothetical protein
MIDLAHRSRRGMRGKSADPGLGLAGGGGGSDWPI